jgi:hypothetical protein
MEPRVSCARCGRAIAPGTGYLEVGEGAGARAYHIECWQAARRGPSARHMPPARLSEPAADEG